MKEIMVRKNKETAAMLVLSPGEVCEGLQFAKIKNEYGLLTELSRLIQKQNASRDDLIVRAGSTQARVSKNNTFDLSDLQRISHDAVHEYVFNRNEDFIMPSKYSREVNLVRIGDMLFAFQSGGKGSADYLIAKIEQNTKRLYIIEPHVISRWGNVTLDDLLPFQYTQVDGSITCIGRPVSPNDNMLELVNQFKQSIYNVCMGEANFSDIIKAMYPLEKIFEHEDISYQEYWINLTYPEVRSGAAMIAIGLITAAASFALAIYCCQITMLAAALIAILAAATVTLSLYGNNSGENLKAVGNFVNHHVTTFFKPQPKSDVEVKCVDIDNFDSLNVQNAPRCS